jgi:hypothetical protein
MEDYEVVVRKRQIEGFKNVFEDVVYVTRSHNAEDAIETIIQTKKVDRKDIRGVNYKPAY